MAHIKLEESKIVRSVRYYGLEESRHRFVKFERAAKMYFFLGIISLFFSPFLSVFFVFLLILKTNKEILSVFFRNENYIRRYYSILQPQTAKNVISTIGYRIYEEEVDSHISLIKMKDTKALMAKQTKMLKPNSIERHVGIDKKAATTHVALVGKTGAGKTECIRSVSDDVMKFGGGIVFNDGKSDTKMLNEVMVQAKENYRETSVQVMNLLKPEKSSESNTFNFINNQHPVKLVEFLGNLAFKEQSDGNTAHFQNRGKALLLPAVSASYLRNQILNEGIDSEIISSNMQIINLTLIYITFYCMCRDIDYIIENNKEVKKIIESKKIVSIKSEYFENIEKLIACVIQEPTSKSKIEKKLNIEYTFIKESYNNVFKIISTYMNDIWSRFSPMLEASSFATYAIGKNGKKEFYTISPNVNNIYTQGEIKEFYNTIREIFSKKTPAQGDIEDAEEMRKKTEVNEIIKNAIIKFRGKKSIFKDLSTCFASDKSSLEKVPSDAMQQHAYAQQQWTSLFNVFTAYKHVFAQTKSEIDPVDLIKDNKILYILLPPLELSKSQVEILGKIIISTIKNFAGYSLGGEHISLHKTIKKISIDKMTPKPFTLVNLDEYGAYPVPDLDTLLAQARSLNIGFFLGIQDFVSLKASGTDETSQKRALGNTSKIFFKIADEDVIKWADSMINEQTVESPEYQRDASGELTIDTKVTIKKEKLIDIRATQDFDDGFCLMMLGAENDRALYVQTFYHGGKSGNVRINHLQPIKTKNLHTNVEASKDNFLKTAS